MCCLDGFPPDVPLMDIIEELYQLELIDEYHMNELENGRTTPEALIAAVERRFQGMTAYHDLHNDTNIINDRRRGIIRNHLGQIIDRHILDPDMWWFLQSHALQRHPEALAYYRWLYEDLPDPRPAFTPKNLPAPPPMPALPAAFRTTSLLPARTTQRALPARVQRALPAPDVPGGPDDRRDAMLLRTPIDVSEINLLRAYIRVLEQTPPEDIEVVRSAYEQMCIRRGWDPSGGGGGEGLGYCRC